MQSYGGVTQISKIYPTLKSSSTRKSHPIRSKNPRRHSSLWRTAWKQWSRICWHRRCRESRNSEWL